MDAYPYLTPHRVERPSQCEQALGYVSQRLCLTTASSRSGESSERTVIGGYCNEGSR